ncbi:hypothetical protein N9057_02395 [Akkermansiaceae bacterium]|nr:hypothetical protein [Akkermansiaceae bacterium]
MNNSEYRRQLLFIRKTIELNDFQLFFTLRDLRNKDSYLKFRSTAPDDLGYYEREKTCHKLMECFRRAYRIRGGKNNKDKFFYFGVHESGLGEKHWLSDDAGHCHLAVGFTKDSKYYSNPKAHLDKFLVFIKGRYSLKWISFCSSLRNEDQVYTIVNKNKVAGYMSKAETGILNGSNFSKHPFFKGSIRLPDEKDLILKPLPLI